MGSPNRLPFPYADPTEMEMVLQEIDIQFERADKGLGLSIAGGLGSTPYKNDDEGIFISRVTPNGPADLVSYLVFAPATRFTRIYFNHCGFFRPYFCRPACERTTR